MKESVTIVPSIRERLASPAAMVPAVGNAKARLPRLRVSANQRFLVTESGEPFFYLADTAWELFHRLDYDEALRYLDIRATQRFTVIQAVAIAELEGLTEPNAYGHLPFVDCDPARPALDPAPAASRRPADYWTYVDQVLDAANERGLYIGLLPSWGSWAPSEARSERAVLNSDNAFVYGEFLGRRYGGKGVIWILGGDRSITGHEEVWRAMARGIASGAKGEVRHDDLLMTFHPPGGGTSSRWFHLDRWLSFNLQQTGHRVITDAERKPCWAMITDDYARVPAKPVIDGEPLYEDHPISFQQAKEHGYSLDAHVRQRAYWDLFSGACGHAYGHHSVWQMYAPGRKPVNGPLLYWQESLHRPGAQQMRHLRALLESRPVLSRVPDTTSVVSPLSGPDRIVATRGDGYMLIYTPQGRPFTVRFGQLAAALLTAWWFNPRSGSAVEIGQCRNSGEREFTPFSLGGFGADAVLVLDDVTKGFGAPGAEPHSP